MTLRIFFFLALLLCLQNSVNAAISCGDYLKKIIELVESGDLDLPGDGQSVMPVNVFGTKANEIHLRQGRFRINELPDYDPLSLYIGIAHTEKDGNHHYYLIAGNKRYEAYPKFVKARIKISQDGSSPLASNGLIFKINVNQETLDLIRANMDLKLRNLSCIHGICKVLKASGVSFVDTEGKRITARRVAVGLLSGRITENGNPVVNPSIYSTSQAELLHFLNSAVSADADEIKQVFLLISGFSINTVLGKELIPVLTNEVGPDLTRVITENSFFVISE